MNTPRTELVPVARDERDRLAQLIELYSHDMSAYVPIALGADCRFGYPRLASYFDEPTQRYPFFIVEAGAVAGFALAMRGSPASDDPTDLDVAEFFVLRGYRRRGVGERAATALWDRFAGRWVVRIIPGNHGAVKFWEGVVGRYARAHQASTRAVDGKERRVLVFTSRREAP